MNTIKSNISTIERGRIIAISLGHFTAARYLAKRGFSIDAAMFILLGK